MPSTRTDAWLSRSAKFGGVGYDLVDVVGTVPKFRGDLGDVLDDLVGILRCRLDIGDRVAHRFWIDAVENLVDLGQRLARAIGKFGDRFHRTIHPPDDLVDLIAGLAEIPGERFDIVDDGADLLLVDRFDQPFGGVERRIELVGGAGQLLGQLGDAGQEIIDAIGIVAKRLREFLGVVDGIGERRADIGDEAFQVGRAPCRRA